MQLNLKTDFALRMLMTLAARDELVSVDWIATHHGVSRNHMAKVAQDLSGAGYIETVRGRGGGVRLAKPAKAINVGDVVRRLETTHSFVACMGDTSSCAIDGVCGLKSVLGGALSAFLAHLDQFTLADITGNRRAMLKRIEAAYP